VIALGAVAGSAGWVLRDHKAIRAKQASDLEMALERAELLLEQGKRAEGLAAFEHASLLAKEGTHDSTMLARLAALKDRLDAEGLDLDFVSRFDEIRLFDQTQVNEAESRYSPETAFPKILEILQRYRITVGVTESAAVVARIQGRPKRIQAYLLAALDECLLRAPTEEAEARRWLVAVLAVADNDSW